MLSDIIRLQMIFPDSFEAKISIYKKIEKCLSVCRSSTVIIASHRSLFFFISFEQFENELHTLNHTGQVTDCIFLSPPRVVVNIPYSQ